MIDDLDWNTVSKELIVDIPSFLHKFNLFLEILEKINVSLMEQREHIVKEAVSKVIGSDWQISDLTGRLHCIYYLNSKLNVMFLYSIPILEIYDPVFTLIDGTASSIMRYRILV